MIEALKSEELIRKVGGQFKLTALIQRRLRELVIDGARPLVEREGRIGQRECQEPKKCHPRQHDSIGLHHRLDLP